MSNAGSFRIGLIGQAGEPHCLAVAAALESLGAEAVLIDASTFDADRRFEFEGTRILYNGEDMASFGAFYLRSILSPVPNVYVEDDTFKLYDDWHQSYMLAREKHGFLLCWLVGLVEAGKPVINPPQFGTVSLLKPIQLQRLERLGFPVPRTLVTNDPDRARDFVQGVGRAIAKPVLGGAFAEEMTPEAMSRLELIRQSPVIFQERVEGPDIRVTAAGGHVLSAVEVESDRLDFRATQAYERGEERLTPVDLPHWVHEMCRQAMEASGLAFTAIDLKRRGADDYVILELNFSPAFLWIERKTGHPISEGLARYLLHCARVASRRGLGEEPCPPGPDRGALGGVGQGEAPARPSQGLRTFFDYGVPKPSAVLGHFGV